MNEDRVGHNSVIKMDLLNAGFEVRWNMNNGLIVSLNRHLSASVVRTALLDAGYEECQFTAVGNGHLVIVDAIC